MKRTLSCVILLSVLLPVLAADFDDVFGDTTLRLDYVLCGDTSSQHIFLDRLMKLPGWAGRRKNTVRQVVDGGFNAVMRDIATDDTLYRTTSSSLFMEWLDTDEAANTARSFSHTILMPMPHRPVIVESEIKDNRGRVTARHSFRLEPSDILIRCRRAQCPDSVYLRYNGSPQDCIDVAILSEGYSADERDAFFAQAETAAASILEHEPFTSYADRFNFLAVFVAADSSGVSEPAHGRWIDSTIQSNFDTFYSRRYLTAPDTRIIHDRLAGVPYEHIVILANTDTYGGGGIYNDYTLTTAGHAAFRPVVAHEFGHSFGGLADEYFYDDDPLMSGTYHAGYEPREPNITNLTDFKSKWADMLEAGTPVPTPIGQCDRWPVGVYEGGGYQSKGVWRPVDRCRMRFNDAKGFCPVCQRALRRQIQLQTGENPE